LRTGRYEDKNGSTSPLRTRKARVELSTSDHSFELGTLSPVPCRSLLVILAAIAVYV
jgi:hypothetical protein